MIFITHIHKQILRDAAELRADGTESAGTGYGLSTDSYSALAYALHKDIGDQVRANSDAIFVTRPRRNPIP